MRILTWNVNALRTVLPFTPWNTLADRSIAGILAAMHASIICFQEHKARRDAMPREMALPDGWDAFFSFPTQGKSGYSGTCVYTRREDVVALRAEEGITGRLLDSMGGNSALPKLVYDEGEKVGGYPGEEEIGLVDEVDGTAFELSRLDREGRAVVCDFGFFVLFNLYCPNETNDSRLPYKLNYLHTLSARVARLIAQGRNVIVLGDLNVCASPLDNGEGGIQRLAEEHYAHPARSWLRDWLAPRGVMHDVTRERWPERRGMFTCWNTKLDARASNYGSRIDYILVTPGLLPWIADSDIQPDVFGSDHCPVWVDLHDSIVNEQGETLFLKDLMNPPIEMSDEAEPVREPPRFATRFWDEFSGKQRSLKDFFGGGGPANQAGKQGKGKSKASKVPSAEKHHSETSAEPVEGTNGRSETPRSDGGRTEARTADATDAVIDLTNSADNSPVKPKRKASTSASAKSLDGPGKKAKQQTQQRGEPSPTQTNLASFFRPPGQSTNNIGKQSQRPSVTPTKLASPPPTTLRSPSATASEQDPDYLYAKALASAEDYVEQDGEDGTDVTLDRSQAVASWSSIFAKKVPPKCRVHHLPCKPFVTKIPGKNKGKKFWLCSKPVGEGWDSGRSKRPREEVNTEYRCDFFLWDSAVKEREQNQQPTAQSTTERSPSGRNGSPMQKKRKP